MQVMSREFLINNTELVQKLRFR